MSVTIEFVPVETENHIVILTEKKSKVHKFPYWTVGWIIVMIIMIIVTYSIAWLLGAINSTPIKEFFP